MTKIKNFLTETLLTVVMFSRENPSVETTSVIREKKEFAHQDKARMRTAFESLDCQESTAKKSIDDSLCAYCTTSDKLPFEILVEEMKLVVRERVEFD